MQRGNTDFETERWEFPGGKIEKGEDPEDALVRELDEELGIRPTASTLFFEQTNRYGSGRTFRVFYFIVSSYEGIVENREERTMAYVDAQELAAFPIISGNEAAVEALLDLVASE